MSSLPPSPPPPRAAALRTAAAFPAVLILALAACARSKPHAGPAPPPPREGTVAYTALADTAAPRAALPRDVEIISPVPLTHLNELPVYPPNALAANAGSATVVVRIIIGVDGSVKDLRDSPVLPSSPGLFAADFRAEVERAVRLWKFDPAEARKLEDGEDYDKDGRPDFQRVTATETIPVYIDLRFDFEIVGGTGRVTGGSTTAP